LEKVEQKEKVIKNSIISAEYFCRLCDHKVTVEGRVAHLNASYVPLFLPFLVKSWTNVLSFRHLADLKDEINMEEQFYENIDQTMALPPLAVKI